MVATKCCVEVSFYEICVKTKYVAAHNGVRIYTDWGVTILVVFEEKVLLRYLLTGTEKGKSNISFSIPSDSEVNRERNLPNTNTAMLLDHSIRSPSVVIGLYIWIYIYIHIHTNFNILYISSVAIFFFFSESSKLESCYQFRSLPGAKINSFTSASTDNKRVFSLANNKFILQ